VEGGRLGIRRGSEPTFAGGKAADESASSSADCRISGPVTRSVSVSETFIS
jgi:hypothetical protein